MALRQKIYRSFGILILGLVCACISKNKVPIWSIEGSSSFREETVASLGLSRRPLEGRLSKLNYRQYITGRKLTRSGRRKIEAIGQNKAKTQGSSLGHSDKAFLHILMGNIQEAILELRRSTTGTTETAQNFSDLSAVLVERANDLNNPLDFVLALNASARAVELEPSLEVGRFNLALSLEKCLLFHESIRAWEEYLHLDSNSSWASEARSHLATLKRMQGGASWDREKAVLAFASGRRNRAEIRRIAAAFPQQTRLYVERDLLPSWASFYLSEQVNQSNSKLVEAHLVTSELTRITGDSMLEDSLAAIDTTIQDNKRSACTFLARGHLAYSEGENRFRDSHFSEARDLFNRAEVLFKRGGSPYHLWAQLRRQFCSFYLPGRTTSSAESLDLLYKLQLQHASSYPIFTGRTQALLGMENGRRGNLAAALHWYRVSASLFEKVKEKENLASINFMIGENLRFQGESESAWVYRRRALLLAQESRSTVYLHNALLDSGLASLGQGLSIVACSFFGEMIDIAIEQSDPPSAVEALLRKSGADFINGFGPAAYRDLSHARLWLKQVPTGDLHQRLYFDIQVALGKLETSQDPVAAIRRLTPAISFNQNAGFRFRLPELYKIRGDAFCAAHNLRGCEADYRAGIEEFEAQRARVNGQQFRSSFFAQARTTFDAMVRLEAMLYRNPRKSFEYSERYRARTLLDQLDQSASRDTGLSQLPLNEIQQRLPRDSAIVEYQVIGNDILVWILRQDQLTMKSLPIRANFLESKISELARVVAGGSGAHEPESSLEGLYDCLVRPILEDIHGIRFVTIVPDKSLNAVPFSALRNSESRRYLVQDLVLTYSPSSTLFVRSEENFERFVTGRPKSILLLGDPEFDRAINPSFERLPNSVSEVGQISQFYQRSEVLVGALATKYALMKKIGNYDVVHIGSHAIIDMNYPMFSGLLLASKGGVEGSGPKEGGELYAYEIYKLKMRRVRLVVLASCSSARGMTSSVEGVASLITPFLAKGVPSVLGNLWQSDDMTSSVIMLKFHKYFKAGLGAAAALRKAQIDCLESKERALRSPVTWGGFLTFGNA